MKLKPIDIVFLIDVRGDMEPVVSAVKAMLKEMIDWLPTQQDWRACVVGFRDIYGDGDDWLVVHPFVHQNPDAILHQIDSLNAFGGWDSKESLLDALLEVCQWRSTPQDDRISESEWRHIGDANRFILLVTNAEYHLSSRYGGTIYDVTSRLASNNLGLMYVAPDSSSYDQFVGIPFSICLGRIEAPFTENFIKGKDEFVTLAARCVLNRNSSIYVDVVL